DERPVPLAILAHHVREHGWGVDPVPELRARVVWREERGGNRGERDDGEKGDAGEACGAGAPGASRQVHGREHLEAPGRERMAAVRLDDWPAVRTRGSTARSATSETRLPKARKTAPAVAQPATRYRSRARSAS